MNLSTAEAPANLVPVPVSFMDDPGINTEQQQILANMRSALKRGLPQLQCYVPQPTPVAVVCGGPSLESTLPELQEQYWDGWKLAAMNGSYEWLLSRGMRPAFMFMVDARAFNARFLTRPAPHCTYWLASQCAPETFDRALSWPKADVRIWHTVAHETDKALLDQWYQGHYVAGGFGTTIGLRTIAILQTLGIRWLDVYGMDSCITTDAHHAYAQPENDGEEVLDVQVGDRWFKATAWQSLQAKETIDALAQYPPDSRITFHGDGLIAHLAKQRERSARKE